jgi:hypothetical protein
MSTMRDGKRPAPRHSSVDSLPPSSFPTLAVPIRLSTLAPSAPPFVQTYWKKVILSPTDQDCVETQDLLDAPAPRTRKLHRLPPAVMEELSGLALPSHVAKAVVRLLAGARRARKHFEALRQPDRRRKALANLLRQANRWPGRIPPSEVARARAELEFLRVRDRDVPRIVTGARTRYPKWWVELCAKTLVLLFRAMTDRPHHDLVGRLMLQAEVFGDSTDGKWCHPWDPLASGAVHCRNSRSTQQSRCRQPCRRARELVIQLARL